MLSGHFCFRYRVSVTLEISVFGPLGAVLGTALPAITYTRRIKASTNSVIANTRQIFYPAAPDQHHAMFLQIMTFSADITGYFVTIRQANTRHLAQCRIRFLWRGRVNTCTNAPFLRATFQRWHIALVSLFLRGLRTSWLIVAIFIPVPKSSLPVFLAPEN